MSKFKISEEQKDELLLVLKKRFEKNMDRHMDIKWVDVHQKLEKSQDKLWSLYQMEETAGEPDVIGLDEKSGAYLFCDCSPESPKGRRSLCYDQEALESRKEHKPKNSAVEMAREMGIEILTEEQYLNLQQIGPFDTKSSSWVMTTPDVRRLGGAVFGDWRYGRVFFYHNGAESYYGARAFRGILKV